MIPGTRKGPQLWVGILHRTVLRNVFINLFLKNQFAKKAVTCMRASSGSIHSNLFNQTMFTSGSNGPQLRAEFINIYVYILLVYTGSVDSSLLKSRSLVVGGGGTI